MSRLLALTATLSFACSGAGLEASHAEIDEPGELECQERCEEFIACVSAGSAAVDCPATCSELGNVCERVEQAELRHDEVSGVRAHDRLVIAHRGSWEFGHENSLEAFRATMELGAEGNEIDVRRTSDGVLVLFHDDFVDHTLQGLGSVSALTYAEMRSMPFLSPGPFAEHTRVATLAEVLDLHRRQRGLIHLDIKVPGIDGEIASLLSAFDMWDHVVLANDANASAILGDTRYRPRSKMIGLSVGRRDVNPTRAARAVTDAIDGIFVDDPRAVLVALGRELGEVSSEPVREEAWAVQRSAVQADSAALLALLADDEGWNQTAATPEAEQVLAARIMARARAASDLAQLGESSSQVLAALRERVRERGMHQDWMVHGVDGQEALRALFALGAADAVSLAREVIERVDPDLAPLAFTGFSLGAVDWRMKGAAWKSLAALGPNAEAAQIARDYLALSDAQALQLGFESHEAATLALLATAPGKAAATLLLNHRREDVRARTILELLKLLDQSWASEALTANAAFALQYRR